MNGQWWSTQFWHQVQLEIGQFGPMESLVLNIQLQVLSLKILDVHPPYGQYYWPIPIYIYIYILYFFFGRFHNHGGTPLFLRWMVTISWNIHRTKWMTGGTVLSQLSADGPQHCIAKNSPVVLQSTCNHFLVWWAAEIMRAWETEKTGHSFPRAFCFDMYLLYIYIYKWYNFKSISLWTLFTPRSLSDIPLGSTWIWHESGALPWQPVPKWDLTQKVGQSDTSMPLQLGGFAVPSPTFWRSAHFYPFLGWKKILEASWNHE